MNKLSKQFATFNYKVENGEKFGCKYRAYNKNGFGSIIHANTVIDLIKHIGEDRKW